MKIEPGTDNDDRLEDQRCVHCTNVSHEGLIKGLFCSRFCEIMDVEQKDGEHWANGYIEPD